MPRPGVFKQIRDTDKFVTPFKTFKRYRTTQDNYSASFGLVINQAVYPGRERQYSGDTIPFGTDLAETNEDINADGSLKKFIWHSINHLYYARINQPYEQFGNWDLDVIDKYLYASASVVSVPQQRYGERIRPGSVYIVDANLSGSTETFIHDDKFGNLRDDTVSTASMVPSCDLVAYWGFNEKYTEKDRWGRYSNSEFGRIVDRSRSHHNISYQNVTFEPGILTTGDFIENSGTKATFHGDGFGYVLEAEKTNFKKDEDFAISFWVELPTEQVHTGSDFNWIISKEGDIAQKYYNPTTSQTEEYVEPYTGQKYPFAVKVFNQNTGDSGKIHVSRCDVNVCPEITSTTSLIGGEHHIVFQKTGSTLQLWVDGVLDGTTTDTVGLNTDNKAILTLGSNGYDNNTGLSGSLDEFRIYKRALTNNEISSLGNNDFMTGSAYNTNRVGNVFYKHGVMVLTDPRPKYKNLLLGRTGEYDYSGSADEGHGFELHFRAEQTIYEHEILCRINEGEFNFTMNPTIRQYNSDQSVLPKGFVSSSEWTPYITTIGLYNDAGQLLAVGKLANPLPKRNDVDLTISVKYDT